MISKNTYKNYIEPLIVFSPIIIFILALQYKTSDYTTFPEWYKMSTVIQKVYESNINKTFLFAGNSYTQSAIRPKELKEKKTLPIFILARGNTPAVELMLWLYKNRIYPKTLVVELNARQLSPQYFADFDLLKPDSEDSFDLLKNKTEVFLRYNIENYLTFLTYKVSPKDAFSVLYNSKSPIKLFKFLFIPKNSNHPEAEFSPEGYTFIPPNSKPFNVEKRTKNYVKDYCSRVKESSPNIDATLKQWQFLIGKFKEHNTQLVLIRLPKNKKMIEIENNLAGKYFNSLKQLAEEKNIPYIDLATAENIEKFNSFLIDGGHWSNKGAVEISQLIKDKLEKIKILQDDAK